MNDGRRGAAACAAIALAINVLAVAVSLSQHDWKLSVLIRMGSDEPMTELALRADPGFRFVDPAAHYDGVYFYTIALDPFARGEGHTRIDRPAYRYGHAGYGWLAWIASGGRASAVPTALLVLSLIGVWFAASAAARLTSRLGWSPWVGGLAVALNPGLVYSVTVDTSEAIGMAAMMLALLWWTQRRWAMAGVAIGAMCLIKEPFLVVVVGLFAWEGMQIVRGHPAPDLRKRLLALAIGPVLFGTWYLYLRATFGYWPFTETSDFRTLPLVGWIDSLKRAATMGTGDFLSSQLGTASVALIAVVGGALLIGTVLSLRIRTLIDPVYFLLSSVVFCLTWLGMLYPKDLIRETTMPLTLLPMVIAGALARTPPALAEVSDSHPAEGASDPV